MSFDFLNYLNLQVSNVSFRFDVIFRITSDKDDVIRVNVPNLQLSTMAVR